MTQEQTLLIEHRGQVDWVTLNRPDSLNALNTGLVDALLDYFTALAEAPSVRIVVLRANGRAFCAGLDLSGNDSGVADRTPRGVLGMQKHIAGVYRAMRRCPQPIISLVQGAACGGGFSLALASDIRIAGESAKMNAAYISIGLTGCDMGSSYFLPRLVGTSVASELLLTGRFIHAPRALAVNLVSEVVADADLEAAAQGYINDMLRTSPMGLRLTKDDINLGVDANSLDAAMAIEDRQQTLLALTDDFTEAAAAFMEKRDPEYRDR
jgi:enoyl-CoA hydratase/carnithine racemase